MSMDFVSLEVRDHIGIVTIDRQPVNAANLQLYGEITDTFQSLNDRDDVRVAILRAEGEKAFMAGNDLNEFATMDPDNAGERMRKIRESFWSVYDCRVPVVGAINGAALGSGLCYAAVCDALVAAEEATFGLPEINVGVMGGAKHLSLLVPRMVVRYMHYTGDTLSASEMKGYGAVMQVVPRESLLQTALDLASRIAKKSPVAVRFAKQSLNNIEDMKLKEAYEFEQGLTGELSGYEDSKEAAQAFFDKREPVFRNR
jgi:enoyl-CoA hydratase